MTTDRAIRTRPLKAEVSNSWAALVRLGSPAEVASWKPAMRMRMKAIPPEMPRAQDRIWLRKALGSVALRQPMAVFTPATPSTAQRMLPSEPRLGQQLQGQTQLSDTRGEPSGEQLVGVREQVPPSPWQELLSV